jgi:dipeptidyl aminopeptidase/acylaminoacyl peptidase
LPRLALVLALLAAACSTDRVAGPASQGLVFARVVEGSLDLARARLADGRVRALTRTPDADETWPYWSAPAQALVFQRAPARDATASDLWLWSAGGGERALTETPRREERWPEWSPVAERLVYAFRGGQPHAGLALVDLALGPRTAVLAAAPPGALYLRPNFAPDGRSLVVQRETAGGRGSALWLLAPGAPPRALTGDPAWHDSKAFFTRDGAGVVFTRRPASGGKRRIAWVAASGGEPRLQDAPDGADEHSARPSPTRDEMAFVSDRDGGSEIFLCDLDGGHVRNLTHTPDVAEYAPRWSPDGERLAVTVAADDAPRLRDLGALAQARVRVLDRQGRVLFETQGLMPDWMPAW